MKIIIFPELITVLLIIVVLSLFKRKKLQNKHAFFWIFISLSAAVSVLIAPTKIIQNVTTNFGIKYPPTFFVFFGFIIIIGILIGQSVSQSKHETEIAKLTQEIALLKKEFYDSHSR